MTRATFPRRQALRQAWSADAIETLTRLYADTPTDEVCRLVNKSRRAVHYMTHKLGIKKSHAFLSSLAKTKIVGVEFRFKKGNVPHNRGKKGWQAGGKSVATRFVTGNRPHSFSPIGSERIPSGEYHQRKLTDTGYPPRDWVNIHHIIWREAGREIPKGYRLCFIDGDRNNLVLENLELVSLADLMRRNSYHNHGPEIAGLIQLRGAIQRQINRRGKPCQT